MGTAGPTHCLREEWLELTVGSLCPAHHKREEGGKLAGGSAGPLPTGGRNGGQTVGSADLAHHPREEWGELTVVLFRPCPPQEGAMARNCQLDMQALPTTLGSNGGN